MARTWDPLGTATLRRENYERIAKEIRPVLRGMTYREVAEIDALEQRSTRARHVLASYGSRVGDPLGWVALPEIARIRAVLVDLGQLSADHGVRLEDLIA